MNTLKNIWSSGILIILVSCYFQVNELSSQDNGQYLYGTVTTTSGETYEGYMRWGKEEVTWHDMFNSDKTGSQQDRSSGGSLWGDFDWSISSLWKDKYKGSHHSFACQFGDIAKLHNRGKSKVDVELKNGSIIKVNGGSNDIGATIAMKDYELGQVKFDWKRVRTISFSEAPIYRSHDFGAVLYGTAKTSRGKKYTGYIKWDEDERIGPDVLDGESRNGRQKVPFENIASIEKSRNGSDVTMNSGRTVFLDGTNDVDKGNRGIIVFQKEIGTISIPWNDFERLDFATAPPGISYSDYNYPKALEGSVTTFDGQVYEGQMMYDADEIWDIEVLDGNDDDIHFEIPFRNIDRIIPKNRSYSLIYLRNGEEMLLGNSQDVSNNNDGIVIIRDNREKPTTIDWADIDIIQFY